MIFRVALRQLCSNAGAERSSLSKLTANKLVAQETIENVNSPLAFGVRDCTMTGATPEPTDNM